MSARIIDGKKIAEEIQREIGSSVAALRQKNVTPGLAVILVGNHAASQTYVAAKEKACHSVGIVSFDHRLPAHTSQQELLALIDSLNKDIRVHGILVQLPLPSHIHTDTVIAAISPDKDVDGFHPTNIGKLVIGLPTLLPCTPHGVVQLLHRSKINYHGAHVVIVGRSNIVGKPLANMLLQKNELGRATVTVCHTDTHDIVKHTRCADIVIMAAGQPRWLTAEMIRDGAVVIDVGIHRVADTTRASGYRLVGDVDAETVKERASAMTVVPGGVGPMTITMLLHNTVCAAGFQYPHSLSEDYHS